MPTKGRILEALKQVHDPEIPVDIVSLGLVYDVAIASGVVRLTMTTTAAACPVGDYLAREVKRALEALDGVEAVAVDLVWDPPWTPERMSPEARKTLGWDEA